MKDATFSKELEEGYYSQNWPEEPVRYSHLEPYLRCWLDPTAVFKGKTVLDIGAGECTYTRLIADRYGPHKVIACELFRQRMLPASRANAFSNLHFVAGDCFRLPVHDESCDVVWGSLVLHQLPNLEDVVAEIRRVLKPSGVYVGFEPNPFNPGILYRFFFGEHSRNQYLLTPDDLGVFRAAGFDVQTTFFYAKFPLLRSRFLTTCLGIQARKSEWSERHKRKSPMNNGWTDDYLNHYYRSRPGWVDGTTQFHELCRTYIRNDSRVCELGAGPSNSTTEFLSKISGSLIGLDVDSSVVQNKFLRKAVVYDGKSFPLPTSSLDVVVTDFVNEHLEDPIAMCKEIHRVLVEGGIFVFRTPNIYHYVSAVARVTPYWFHQLVANRLRNLPPEQSEPHPTYYRFNSRKAIETILRGAGFKILHLEFIEKDPSYGMSSRVLFFLFMGYERLVNSTPLLAGFRSNILCVASKS